MKKLKIGLLSYRSDPFSGGQGIYVKNVSEALLNRGHEVTIFSGKPLPVVDERIKVVEIITPGYFETFNSLERFKIFQAQEKTRLNLWDFIETFTGTFTEPIFFGDRLLQNKEFANSADSYDVFHDNQSICGYPDSITKKLVTTLHHPIHVDRDIDLKNESSFLNKLSIKRWYSFLNLQKKNLKKVKKVISPSKSSKKDICHYFEYPAEQISVIWNGIDLEDCKFHQRTSFDSKFVTIISSDVPMKNLKNILKALYLLKNDGLKAKLTIIGDLREDNEKLIKDLDLNELVSFKRKLPRNELLKTLNESDVGIAASSYEGFGFPPLEAMTYGCPVISSNNSAIIEATGISKFTFDPDDPNDIINVLEKVVSSKENQKFLQNYGITRVKQFSAESMIKNLKKTYKMLT